MAVALGRLWGALRSLGSRAAIGAPQGVNGVVVANAAHRGGRLDQGHSADANLLHPVACPRSGWSNEFQIGVYVLAATGWGGVERAARTFCAISPAGVGGPRGGFFFFFFFPFLSLSLSHLLIAPYPHIKNTKHTTTTTIGPTMAALRRWAVEDCAREVAATNGNSELRCGCCWEELGGDAITRPTPWHVLCYVREFVPLLVELTGPALSAGAEAAARELVLVARSTDAAGPRAAAGAAAQAAGRVSAAVAAAAPAAAAPAAAAAAAAVAAAVVGCFAKAHIYCSRATRDSERGWCRDCRILRVLGYGPEQEHCWTCGEAAKRPGGGTAAAAYKLENGLVADTAKMTSWLLSLKSAPVRARCRAAASTCPRAQRRAAAGCPRSPLSWRRRVLRQWSRGDQARRQRPPRPRPPC